MDGKRGHSEQDPAVDYTTTPRKRARRLASSPADMVEDPPVQSNGHAGPSVSDAPLGTQTQFQRSQYIRLLEQALHNLGFSSVANRLEKESGVRLQAEEVTAFRQAILDGDWDRAVDLLPCLQLDSHSAKLAHARFLILEQKYLEALERKDLAGALKCLRMDMAPLAMPASRLHQLASQLLCQSPEDLHSSSTWPGPAGGSRQQLLVALQGIAPPDVMLPERRLEVLLEQALHSQMNRSLYHNTSHAAVSLLSDYKCGREQLPSVTTQVLLDHGDEVWHLQFSHNGQMLASASRDSCAIIWTVVSRRQVIKRHVLRGHSKAITLVAWSPDDSLLATCSNDKQLKLWDPVTGMCVRTLSHHTEAVTCVAWLPDGKRLVTGGHDRYMYLCDLEGRVLRSWKGWRVNDLATTQDGRVLSTSTEKRVRIHDLAASDGNERSINESEAIISLSVSADSRMLLLNFANQHIHMWELPADPQAPLPLTPTQKYVGPQEKQGRYIVRSCFGGLNQAFVLSGSEECKVYIWHRDTGELLSSLEGHSGTVNAVSWNPVDHQMFASASDDKSIHIWGLESEKPPSYAAIAAKQ